MKKIIALLCVLCLLATMFTGCRDAGGTETENKTQNGTENETENENESGKENGLELPCTYIVLQQFDGKLGILYNDTCILTSYAFSYDLPISYSLDGAAAVCLTKEGALLYIYDGTVVKLADNPVNYCISVSGDVVAYQLREGGERNLYLYHQSNGYTEQVTSGADVDVRSYTLSPDGKTLAYVVEENLFLHRRMESTLFKQLEGVGNYHLISINDRADLIYMHDHANVISLNGEGAVTKVGKTDDQSMDDGRRHVFYTNADHSQLMMGGSYDTYLSNQGQKGARIGGGGMHPVERAFSQFHYDRKSSNAYVVTCDFEDLGRQVMHNLADARMDPHYYWYPNETGDYVELAMYYVLNEEVCWLDPTGSYLYYMDDVQALYLLDLKNGGKSTLLVEKISHFAITFDCSALYYAWNGLSRCDATKISEPTNIPLEGSFRGMFCSENGQVFFRLVDGVYTDLYTVSEDGEVLVVLQNVQQMLQYPCGMIFLAVGKSFSEIDGYYIIRDGELMALNMKIMEGASFN